MHRAISLFTRCGVPRMASLSPLSSVSMSSSTIAGAGGGRFISERGVCTTLQRLNAVQELSSALDEEIKAEKELVQDKLGGDSAPSVPGFNISTNGAEVRLTKTHGNEKIVVQVNVNHSVGIEEDEEYEEESSTAEETESVPVALPHFTISITKKNTSLFFSLEMVKTEEGGFDFTVEEFFIAPAVNGVAKEDIGDEVYSSSGKYIDPKLHDLLFVRYLEERGFSPDFCQQLVSFVTHHEHALYVAFLDSIKKFVAE
ncbi:hypothetical protein GPALN_013085 [Globodera pallida]|nr:hypothetical protein GPALN_013085 [Globodera pallida]